MQPPAKTPAVRLTSVLLVLASATWVVRCAAPTPLPPRAVASKPDAATHPATPDAKPPEPGPVEGASPVACRAVQAELPELIASTIDVTVPPVVDPNGAMHAFHERVGRLLRGKARDHVRIGVFGDSNMTMDWITGEMRRTLQEKYGDAGHGYVALGRPWNWYRHMDVRSGHERLDWTAFAVSTHPSQDRAYGFAGIAARSERAQAITWVATAPGDAPIGTRASRFDVYYLKKPNAGAFEIRVDGAPVSTVSTDGPELEAGFHEFSLADAPHKVQFVATSFKSVTLFGVSLEREAPSFVIDSLGVGAVSGPLLLRQNADVMKASLARRKYDLIILLLGSNQVWPVKYESWMGELIARFRDALPNVSVLMMTPVDQVTSVKATRSVPDLALVARQNEKIARANKCAFWDFRGAMGGEASMVRFIATGMGHADGIHLTQKGARYMGRRILHAVLGDYDRYAERHPEAGCTDEAARATPSD